MNTFWRYLALSNIKPKIRIQWCLWATFVVVAAAGAILFHLSSSPVVVPLKLTPKESVDVSVFRVLPDTLHLSLRFNRSIGQRRPELGSHTTRKGSETTRVLEFPEPGESIKLLVQSSGKDVVYEAMPAGAYGTTIGRSLVPFVNDGNPKEFRWPPNPDLNFSLSPGREHLKISVTEVGEKISGEQVSIVIRPLVTPKSYAPNYGWLWWFMWWPMYALLLAIYGGVLLLKTACPNRSPDVVP